MIRIAVSAVILVLLIAATVVRVVALWPQGPLPVVSERPLGDIGDLSVRSLAKEPLGLLQQLEKRGHQSSAYYEVLQLQGLLLFQGGDLDEVISQIDLLTRIAPRFELAHLVFGDLLLARFTPLQAIGGAAPAVVGRPHGQRLTGLRSEARARLHSYLSRLNDHQVPRALITLGEGLPYALVIDKSKNRLFVFRNQGDGLPPQLVDDFYIVLGQQVGDKWVEGDLNNPTGTYFVASYIAVEKLPLLDGSGAFPNNYPNEFDRKQQKSGFVTWLHGTDRSLFSRPPLDSEGCVVLTNEEFENIRQYIVFGRTPAIISKELEWLEQNDWQAQKSAIKGFIEEWRLQWQEGDLQAYLGMYAEDFWTTQHDYRSWSHYKQQVFSSKTYQQIALSDLSLYEYPRDDNG